MKTIAIVVAMLASWTSVAILLQRADAHAAGAAVSRARSAPKLLRVCADPNNLPFSNERGEGFENRLAELVANRLGARVSYTFWPQRRGFIKYTLGKNLCDVVIGVPALFERTENTRPYYRSSYVFVTRAADTATPSSLDDPLLRRRRIGVHVIGDDYNNVPPAESLARRGLVSNVHGYSIYGDYSQPSPPRGLIDAVERNEIDVAIAWGPLAGPFVKRAGGRLRMERVTPVQDGPALSMSFDIAMGVRRGDHQLRAQLDRLLLEEQSQIRTLLEQFGVPFEAPARKEPP